MQKFELGRKENTTVLRVFVQTACGHQGLELLAVGFVIQESNVLTDTSRGRV